MARTEDGVDASNTELAVAAALADAAANPTVPGVGAFNLGFNGTNWDRLRTRGTGILQVEPAYSFLKVTGDTQVKAGAGTLHTVVISCNDAAPTAGSVIIYDSLTEADTQIFNHTFTTTAFVPVSLLFDVAFATGLYVGFTTTADVNVTVTYR